MRTIIAGSRKCPHYHLVCQAVEEAGLGLAVVVAVVNDVIVGVVEPAAA